MPWCWGIIHSRIRKTRRHWGRWLSTKRSRYPGEGKSTGWFEENQNLTQRICKQQPSLLLRLTRFCKYLRASQTSAEKWLSWCCTKTQTNEFHFSTCSTILGSVSTVNQTSRCGKRLAMRGLPLIQTASRDPQIQYHWNLQMQAGEAERNSLSKISSILENLKSCRAKTTTD